MGVGERRQLKAFISYIHEDDGLCQQLLEHPVQLRRHGLIENWYRRKSMGAREKAGQIDRCQCDIE